MGLALCIERKRHINPGSGGLEEAQAQLCSGLASTIGYCGSVYSDACQSQPGQRGTPNFEVRSTPRGPVLLLRSEGVPWEVTRPKPHRRV